MDDKNSYVKLLVSTLEKQIATLSSILDITKEQGNIADKEPFDENLFYDTLTRKDALIIRLNELDDGFVSIFDRVRKTVKENPDFYKDEVLRMQSMIKECTDIGNEIQTLESRNREKLVNCFAGKRQEYSAKQTAASVVRKYHAAMKNGLSGSGYRFNQDQ